MPDGSTNPALIGELQEALAVLRTDDDGPGDLLVDEIAIARNANTTKAMEKAAAAWREYRCCVWMNDAERSDGGKEAGHG